MTVFSESDIESFEKSFRTKFINGITGFKSANLIGTKSESGVENLAVFSSVVHIGSHPPYLGFVTRPVTVPRNTYENIKSTGLFTVNAIPTAIAENAHGTSAKYQKETSEFEKCDIPSHYENDFFAPFVANAPIGIGCEFVEEIEIKTNATRMIIGRMKLVILQGVEVAQDGFPGLNNANIATISSLDAYHRVEDPRRFEYARPDEPVKEIHTWKK